MGFWSYLGQFLGKFELEAGEARDRRYRLEDASRKSAARGRQLTKRAYAAPKLPLLAAFGLSGLSD